MAIKLTSDKYKVTAIKKPTKAALFGAMKVGDEIQFTMYMKAMAGASGGGVYASVVTTHNLTQGTSAGGKSQTEVVNILDRSFEIEPVE